MLQTYTPEPQFGFRTPAHPERFRAVDHFDTYTGEVARPLDLSRAQPLLCAYPSQPPHAGDYFTLPDVPAPSPGHATCILTAATSNGERRAGRKTNVSGKLVGRDASVLPACAIETAPTASTDSEGGSDE